MSSAFNITTDPINNRIAIALSKLNQALKSNAWSGASQQGLTPTQGEILNLLRSKGNREMRIAELAEGLGVTSATVSDSVSALVDKDLVTKQRSLQDARAVAVTLTEQGKQEAEQVAAWPNFLLDALDELSLAEQEIFLRALLKVVRSLQQRGIIPIDHMCVTCHYFHANVYANPDRPHHCAFVDAPFGTRHLQIDCRDHQRADSQKIEQTWRSFLAAEQSSSLNL